MTSSLTFEYAQDDYLVQTDEYGDAVATTPLPVVATPEWWADVDLEALWAAFVRDFRATAPTFWATPDRSDFLTHVRRIVAETDEVDIVWCEACQDPTHADNAEVVNRGEAHACQSCYQDDYRTCDDCGEAHHYENFHYTLSDDSVCGRCSDNYYSFCEDCDGYYRDTDSDDHDHRGGCDCLPTNVVTMRNGDGILAADERITLGLPAGVISDEGIRQIEAAIRNLGYAVPVPDWDAPQDERNAAYAERDKWWNLLSALPSLGAEWQTREGNFTKRLSKLAHKTAALKIPAETISQIGNIARDNSKGADVNVEITRELNMSAEDFYHEDSCWWQSYSESRCSLKNNGGIGLRTFGKNSWGTEQVTGRAWIMPLTVNGPDDLNPTFDAVAADAFVVFNGYGDLEGYTAARIVAAMSGMSYRKISFTNDPMYVNGNAAYLVGAQDLITNRSSLYLDTDAHSNLFYTEQSVAAVDAIVADFATV